MAQDCMSNKDHFSNNMKRRVLVCDAKSIDGIYQSAIGLEKADLIKVRRGAMLCNEFEKYRVLVLIAESKYPRKAISALTKGYMAHLIKHGATMTVMCMLWLFKKRTDIKMNIDQCLTKAEQRLFPRFKDMCKYHHDALCSDDAARSIGKAPLGTATLLYQWAGESLKMTYLDRTIRCRRGYAYNCRILRACGHRVILTHYRWLYEVVKYCVVFDDAIALRSMYDVVFKDFPRRMSRYFKSSTFASMRQRPGKHIGIMACMTENDLPAKPHWYIPQKGQYDATYLHINGYARVALIATLQRGWIKAISSTDLGLTKLESKRVAALRKCAIADFEKTFKGATSSIFDIIDENVHALTTIVLKKMAQTYIGRGKIQKPMSKGLQSRMDKGRIVRLTIPGTKHGVDVNAGYCKLSPILAQCIAVSDKKQVVFETRKTDPVTLSLFGEYLQRRKGVACAMLDGMQGQSKSLHEMVQASITHDGIRAHNTQDIKWIEKVWDMKYKGYKRGQAMCLLVFAMAMSVDCLIDLIIAYMVDRMHGSRAIITKNIALAKQSIGPIKEKRVRSSLESSPLPLRKRKKC